MATGFLLVGVGLSAMVGSRPAAMVGHGPSASATRMPPTPTALARMRCVLPSVQQAALLGSTTPARLLLHDFFMAHDDADGAAGGGVSGGLYGGEKSGPTFPLTGPSTLAAGPPAPLLASTLACSSTPHRFVEGGRLGANLGTHDAQARQAAAGGGTGGQLGGPLGGETSLAAGGGETSGATSTFTTAPSTLAAGPPIPTVCDVSIGGNVVRVGSDSTGDY